MNVIIIYIIFLTYIFIKNKLDGLIKLNRVQTTRREIMSKYNLF